LKPLSSATCRAGERRVAEQVLKFLIGGFMDYVLINDQEFVLKNVTKIIIVCGDGRILLVDPEGSTKDVYGKDVVVGYYNSSSQDGDVYIDVADKGLVNTALSCLYSRGIG
jgi:hypothetical protein